MILKVGLTLTALLLVTGACAGDEEGRATDKESHVGPRDVVARFYADAAELNCEGAANSAIFRRGDAGRNGFVTECEKSNDLTWAQQVEIGEPKPAPASDMKDVKSVWPDATDLVTIPVAEGTSPGSPSDAYVVKISGQWLFVIR